MARTNLDQYEFDLIYNPLFIGPLSPLLNLLSPHNIK